MRAQGLTVARIRLASRLIAPSRAAVNVEHLTAILLPRSVTKKSTIAPHSLPSVGSLRTDGKISYEETSQRPHTGRTDP
jgi:hypothetical protein